jgi:hypothetical protein
LVLQLLRLAEEAVPLQLPPRSLFLILEHVLRASALSLLGLGLLLLKPESIALLLSVNLPVKVLDPAVSLLLEFVDLRLQALLRFL